MTRCFRKYVRSSTCFRILSIIFLLQILLCLFRYSLHQEKLDIYNANVTVDELKEINLLYASEGSWQNISSANPIKALVFSAFLDIRRDRLVRVIAVTITQKILVSKVWCKLWFNEKHLIKNARIVEGQYKIIKENWDLPYSAYYILCPLSDEPSPIPDAVSLLSTPEQTPENLLKVIVNYVKGNRWNSSELTPLVDKMAVCVKPLHYDYNSVMELLEFIELHQILGVNHFYLYNHTVGPQVNCILKKYQQERLVTILPWELPLVSPKEIRTEGIFASLNDCLYRTMHKYSHVVFVDFDEYILPTNNYTYRDMFRYFHDKKNIKIKSMFSFRNAFFYRQWPDDPEVKLFNDPIAENLLVLRKTTRKTELHPHRTRSKMIVRPELVNMVGNHFIWEYYNIKEFGKMDVNPKEAFSHHYRVCEFGGDDCVNQSSVVDKTTYRYKDELIKAVKTRYIKFMSECQLTQINDLRRESLTQINKR